MWDLCRLIWWVVVDLFRPRAKLEAEILVLRQQINVLRRTAPKRLLLSSIDRLIFVGLYRLFPNVRGALTIVKPDTVMRWHRAGFRAYWRWKSRIRRGRPKVPLEIRQLIRDMSLANPLWGAPRIHGELLKLGIDVGQTSLAKYMARHRRPPSQGWRTFLLNHADGIASIDLFVVPTISFRLLYGLLVLRHDRRRILWLGTTAHPTAEWIARQLTEACGWERAPEYLIHDRDRAYGEVFTWRVRAMGIRDRPTSPRSPWQNAYAERLTGSIRRECRRAWGAAPSARTAVVHEILQRGAHTLITEQGCAGTARRPGLWAHSVPANLGRIASPIRPDLIFDRNREREAVIRP